MKKYNIFNLYIIKIQNKNYYLICKKDNNNYTEIFTKEKIKKTDISNIEPLSNYYSNSKKLNKKELLKLYITINTTSKDNVLKKSSSIPNSIKEMASSLIDLYALAYEQIKPKVNYIIQNNIINKIYIEQVLDELLNIPYEPSYQLLVKLCNYTSKFDTQLANDYLELWNDLYEEKPKSKKRN